MYVVQRSVVYPELWGVYAQTRMDPPCYFKDKVQAQQYANQLNSKKGMRYGTHER